MPQRPRSRHPTIIDVARRAGVSHTTVSFVINNVVQAGITDETRERVLAAIAELDYHPHAGARSMGRRSSLTIGVAIPDNENTHYHEIAAGVETYAALQGYSTLLTSTNFQVEREQRCFDWLKEQRIDGLILIPGSGRTYAAEFDAARRRGYPLVMFSPQHGAVDTVSPQAISGEQQLIEHLAGLGHRDIGYIYGVADQTVYGERLRICLQLAAELSLPPVERWIRRCGPTVEHGYRATKQLLAECDAGDRPTALVVVNDLLAAAVIAALHDAGVRVPEHISVAGFDNTLHARYTVVPRLTSVDYDAHNLGTVAARMLLERLARSRAAAGAP